jgi:hypothetical protein
MRQPCGIRAQRGRSSSPRQGQVVVCLDAEFACAVKALALGVPLRHRGWSRRRRSRRRRQPVPFPSIRRRCPANRCREVMWLSSGIRRLHTQLTGRGDVVCCGVRLGAVSRYPHRGGPQRAAGYPSRFVLSGVKNVCLSETSGLTDRIGQPFNLSLAGVECPACAESPQNLCDPNDHKPYAGDYRQHIDGIERPD